jgi:hypothetical protein
MSWTSERESFRPPDRIGLATKVTKVAPNARGAVRACARAKEDGGHKEASPDIGSLELERDSNRGLAGPWIGHVMNLGV